jgi:hypothetical protein
MYTGPHIVDDGLILAIDAGSARSYPGSGTAWNDLSSTASVYTLTNGPSFNSGNGGSFDFDGADDFAATSSAPIAASATAYSFEAVFKADTASATQVIWEQGTTVQTSGRRVCMILLSTGVGGFNGQNADFQTSVNYSVNVWYNWTITVDTTLSSNKIKIYVNGVLSAQGNPTGTLNAGADGARVGNKLSNSTEDFNGKIALVRAYNKVLTAAEVAQNYNAQESRFL